MDEVVRLHRPSALARRRAAAAGVELEALKHSDPQRYKMLCAQPILVTQAAFVDDACALYWAAFRYELFKLERPPQVTLLSFPELTAAELRRWDRALGQLVALPKYRAQGVFYRVVGTLEGELRQLGLPLAPAAWQGEREVLVGPFDSEAAAKAWAARLPEGYAHDCLQQDGRWLCDVFGALSLPGAVEQQGGDQDKGDER